MKNQHFNTILAEALAQQKRITNADRIRSLSDEELAESLGILTDCTQCVCKNTDDSCNIVDGTCQKQWLDWLREETK